MEIKNDYSKPLSTQHTTTPEPSEKSQRLPENSTIKGEIIDIKRNEVTIRTDSGEIVTGKLQSPIEAKIGQEHSFNVKYDSQGELVLNMKEVPKETMNKHILTDTLNSMGFKGSEENLKLATLLLNNQLPLSKETMQKLNQALKLMGEGSIEKALYLMQNDIKVSVKNANTLEGFVNGQIKISAQLESLISNIKSMEDSPLKNQLIDTLINGNRDEIINNLVKSIKTESSGIENSIKDNILKAFQNDNLFSNLDQKIITKLSEQLIKEFPEHKDLIENLANEKASLIKFADENKQDIKQKISQLFENEALLSEKTPKELLKEITQIIKGDKPNIKVTENEINSLLKEIFKDEPQQMQKILSKLNIPFEKEQPDLQKLASKLSFDIKNSSPKELEQFLNNLKENIDIAKNLLSKNETTQNMNILKDISGIKDNLEFVSHIKNNLFVQIPLSVDGGQTNAELFVFKDGKNKRTNKNGVLSALIALDTLNLGRFETYIQKNSKKVNCQFRLENENTQEVVKKNIIKLSKQLEKYDFILENYSFIQLEQSFTVVDDEPKNEFSIEQSGTQLGKIFFDMRT